MPRATLNGYIEIISDRCDFCGTCVAVCPVDCIELAEYRLTIDHNVCTLCKNCVVVCPVEALSYKDATVFSASEGRV